MKIKLLNSPLKRLSNQNNESLAIYHL